MCVCQRECMSIEKVLERGEIFDLLVDRTDKLNRNSVKFGRSATTLRKTMWRRNVKLWVLLVFVGLVRGCLHLLLALAAHTHVFMCICAQFVIYLVISMACGFDFSGCGHKSGA